MSLERADKLNITGIWHNVTAANGLSMTYSPANRLKTTYFAPWGQNTYSYDLVGNRTQDIYTNPSSVVTTRTYSLASTSNRLNAVTAGTTTERTYVHDNAGNITSDTRSGTAYAYAYNKRNRLNTVTVGGVLKSTYTYNGLEQVTIRALTNMTPSGTTHFIYDRNGNLIAETAGGGGATGATGTVREYIYLPETEIAPTFGSRTVVERPLAVVNAVNTASPALWHVHTDHLNRPVRMTDAAQAVVWNAQWLPWGNVFAITGTANLDARFPGQWFQLESGLHYNWYRHYDPTIGRFTQPDPLGFVDGPSVYAYGRSSPLRRSDKKGLTTYVVTTHDSYGGHAGVVVIGENGKNALYDPGGSYVPSNGAEIGSGRLLTGSDVDLQDYVGQQGPGAVVTAFPTTPDEEAAIIQDMDEIGGCTIFRCAQCSSEALRNNAPQFRDLPNFILPRSLRRELMRRGGVNMSVR